MIAEDNFKALLRHLQFDEKGYVFTKNFEGIGVFLKVDFKNKKLAYPESAGLKINERQTLRYSHRDRGRPGFDFLHGRKLSSRIFCSKPLATLLHVSHFAENRQIPSAICRETKVLIASSFPLFPLSSPGYYI